MSKSSIIAFLLLVNYQLYSQSIQIIEPISSSLGGSSILNKNAWATIYNPSMLPLVEQTTTSLAYANYHQLNKLASNSLTIAIPLKNDGFGISFHRFGYNLYREQRAGLSYGILMGQNLSAGIELAYYNLQFGIPYKSKSKLVGSFGLQSTFTNKVIVGFYFQNLSNTSFDESQINRAVTTQKIAFNYLLSEQTNFLVEINKGSNSPIDLIFGINYQPSEKLHLRTGLSTNSNSFCLGLGWELKKIIVDVSHKIEPIFGFHSAISLTMKL